MLKSKKQKDIDKLLSAQQIGNFSALMVSAQQKNKNDPLKSLTHNVSKSLNGDLDGIYQLEYNKSKFLDSSLDSSLDSKVSSLDSKVSSLDSKTSSLDSNVDSKPPYLDSSLDSSLDSDANFNLKNVYFLGTSNKFFQNLNQKTSSLDSKIQSLDSKSSSLDSKIQSLDSKIQSLDSSLDSDLDSKNDPFQCKFLDSSLDSKIKETQPQSLDSSLDSIIAAHKDQSLDSSLDSKTARTTSALLIRSLKGLQKRLFEHILTKEGEKLRTNELAHLYNCSANMIKNSLDRLQKKRLVLRLKGRKSWNGYIKFSVPKCVKNCLIYNSYDINNITTKKEVQEMIFTLPKNWQEIDIQPLAHIGFSLQHIATLHQTSKVTPEMVQDSINAYAWGLENNADAYKRYKNHLTVLLGVLKKGMAWIESGYESPQELAFKSMIARRYKQKSQQDKMIDDLVAIEFPQWEMRLDKAKRNNIAPKEFDLMAEDILKSHFKKHVLIPRLLAEGKILSFEDMDQGN